MSVSSVPNADRLAVRWTIGDVRPRGFEMLRLSISCAQRLLGDATKYVVCVNTVPLEEARERTGNVPSEVEWLQVTAGDAPEVLRRYCDEQFIEGMGWKLIPLRIYPERYELALDNDCIVWEVPAGMREWLSAERAFLFAEDVERCFGSFDELCLPMAMNAGIRGLPPGVDVGEALTAVLEEMNRRAGGRFCMKDEIDEQGLQAAAMSRLKPLHLVRTAEVSLCSPFWPRMPELGPCGAHFVGMNAAHIPWDYYDRPADEWLEEHWLRHRPALYEKAGLLLP